MPQAVLGLLLTLAAHSTFAADYPQPQPGDYVIRDFRLQSGETLPELRMHYLTFGNPQRDANGEVRNAVLILHGTTGNSSNFVRAEFAGELFGPGQPLDAARYYLVIPDNLGHGKSSKPSDGLRAHFPRYGYRDMIEAQYRLLTEGLKVTHLRLVMGTSMGGMHTWLWGESHPEFMDALLPLASLPSQISGRNRVWRRLIIDAIRTDPEWQNGDYQVQPHGLQLAAEVLYFMGNNPVQRQQEAPTLAKADQLLDAYVRNATRNLDANDVLYALEASQDYDPAPDLEKIRAPLLAINFEDDLINPPELGLLEREIKRVKQGKAILIPRSDRTRGHGTHTLAALWKEHLAVLLRESLRVAQASSPVGSGGVPPPQRAESTAVRQRIAFPDARIEVSGLPWSSEDKPVLRRLPARLKDRFRPPVWDLAQSPSGGRLRFRTDSTTIGLVAENPRFSNMHHMASVGENGFDLYVGADYVGSAWPDAASKIAKEWKVGPERKMRDITLYLPLYKAVTIHELSLDTEACLEQAKPYAIAKPVVYYGSSITQGGCASNPGGSCQALLERKLNVDFVNLGFSGNGLGEPALAEAICELDPSCIVLDFWGNPSSAQYAAALPVFVDILRKKWPRLPILVTGPFYFPAEENGGDVAREQSAKRRTASDFVQQRRKAGDRKIWYVDGLRMLNRNQTAGLVDGVHCNSLGFYFNSLGLEPYLRKALK